MLRKAENVFSVVLDDVNTAASGVPSVGNQVTSQNLPNGAVVLVDTGMYRISSVSGLADGEGYFIVQGKGAGQPLMKSPQIVKGTETLTSAKFKPSKQQMTLIGGDGSTVVNNDTSYYVKIRKNDNDEANRSQPYSLFGQYKTGASATQREIFAGVTKNFNYNMRNQPANNYAKAQLVFDIAASNTAFSALTNPTGDITVTKRSPIVTMTDTQDLAVGDYFRISEGTETVNDPVYRIKSVDSGTQVTLDAPYVGNTEVIDDSGVFHIDKSTGDAANFGMKLVGIQGDFDVNAFRNYYVNRFTATFSDSNTVITHLQGASEGNGMWQQVAMDEYMNYGYEGQNEMLSVPPKMRDQEVKVPGKGSVTALDAKYSVVNIKWKEDITGLVSKSGAEGNVLVYLNLEDSTGSGILNTSNSSGEALATALGLTPSDLDE